MQHWHRWWRGASPVGYALLIGGTTGNLIDRYPQGPDFPSNAVVDWLSFGGTTLNLADVFIVATVLFLVGDGSREGGSRPERNGGVTRVLIEDSYETDP